MNKIMENIKETMSNLKCDIVNCNEKSNGIVACDEIAMDFRTCNKEECNSKLVEMLGFINYYQSEDNPFMSEEKKIH